VPAPSRQGSTVAVIRVLVDPSSRPIIRILALTHLDDAEHVLRITSSADEAVQVIRDWLRDVTTQAPIGDA
jgi:hypothetical protein